MVVHLKRRNIHPDYVEHSLVAVSDQPRLVATANRNDGRIGCAAFWYANEYLLISYRFIALLSRKLPQLLPRCLREFAQALGEFGSNAFFAPRDTQLLVHKFKTELRWALVAIVPISNRTDPQPVGAIGRWRRNVTIAPAPHCYLLVSSAAKYSRIDSTGIVWLLGVSFHGGSPCVMSRSFHAENWP